jgi:hypothetical protein
MENGHDPAHPRSRRGIGAGNARAGAGAAPNKPAVTPTIEHNNPDPCVNAPSTVGQGGDVDDKTPHGKSLSEKLARSNGVICPPPRVDPAIKQPAPPGGIMPVIPPPDTPGGAQIQPK